LRTTSHLRPRRGGAIEKNPIAFFLNLFFTLFLDLELPAGWQ
jgi:hypothetical protein